MSDDFYIKLTLAVYRVTDLFPENVTLKEDIRNLANEILVNLFTNDSEKCSRNIEKMKDLLDLAEGQNWVDSRNFLVLRREYDKIGGKPVENSLPKGRRVRKLTKERQEKILDLLRENGKIKVGILLRTFPGVNRRTLLRDLEDFSRTGVIIKNGNGRGVCYSLRNATL